MAKFDLFGKLGKAFGGVIRDLQGESITIRKKTIIVDGKVITDEAEGVVELRITEGILKNAECGMDLTCGEVQGNARAGMAVKCGNVGGDVHAGMDVRCGTVAGDVDGSMSVTVTGDIHGNATAGMSIKTGSVRGKSRSGM